MAFERITTNGALATVALGATSITPNSTGWANATYVEVTASYGSDAYLLGVSVLPPSLSGIDYEIDVAVGAAASEVVIATLTGTIAGVASRDGHAQLDLALPIDGIASGDRIAVRLRKTGTDTTAWTALVHVADQPVGTTITSTTNPSLVAPSAADSVTITNAGSAWANTAFTEIIASTSDAIVVGAVICGAPGFGGANQSTECDVATGPAASETVVTTIRVGQSIGGPAYFLLSPALDNIASGVRVSVRVRSSLNTGDNRIRLVYWVKTGIGTVSNRTTALPLQWMPAAADCTQVAQSATDWVHGSWVEFDASLGATTQVAALQVGTTVGAEKELDLGTGTAGAEVVRNRIRLVHTSSAGTGQNEVIFSAPLNQYASGARFALRCRGDGTNVSGIRVAVGYYEGVTGNVATAATVVSPDGATGATVTPSGTAFNWSAWAELEATVASAQQVLHLSWHTSAILSALYALQIGTGGAGSESPVLTVVGASNRTDQGTRVLAVRLPHQIAWNSRLSVRLAKSGTDTTAWTLAATLFGEEIPVDEQYTDSTDAGVRLPGAPWDETYHPTVTFYANSVAWPIDKDYSSVQQGGFERPTTATLRVPDRNNALATLRPGTAVSLKSGTVYDPQFLISGKIIAVTRTQAHLAQKPALVVHVSGWTHLLDTRLVRGTFAAGWDLRSMVATLITSWAPPSVTWDTTQMENCGTLGEMTFEHDTLLTAIARIMTQNGVTWRVDGDASGAILHAHLGEEAGVTAATDLLATVTPHFWDLEWTEDWSQVRNRAFVEGAGVSVLTKIPTGARAAPTAEIPDWYYAITSVNINSLTYVRLGHQLLSNPVFDGGLGDPAAVVTSVTTNVAVGANTIAVAALGNRMINAPAWVKINENWIYFRSKDIPSNLIYDIPSSGYGSIISSIAAGAAVFEPISLKWTQSLTAPVEEGTTAALTVVQVNDAGRSLAVDREGGDGYRDIFIQDATLTVAAAIARGNAEVDLFGLPEYSGQYYTRDPYATPGKFIWVAISTPSSAVSSVQARIDDVVITRLIDSDQATAYTLPVRKVSFTSHRYRDVFQVIRVTELLQR